METEEKVNMDDALVKHSIAMIERAKKYGNSAVSRYIVDSALVNINIGKKHQEEMVIVNVKCKSLTDELARIRARWTWRLAAWVVGMVKRCWKFQ